jgi:transcriptional regulator with XRE-family HTH domain
MSLKIAFASVLKALRAGKGLTQRNLAEVSSRTYVSKLERAQSSPTLEMITALSGSLSVNPLTLVAITLCAESGQSVNALLRHTQEELADLAREGVLVNLSISSGIELLVPRPSTKPSSHRSVTKPQQIAMELEDVTLAMGQGFSAS